MATMGQVIPDGTFQAFHDRRSAPSNWRATAAGGWFSYFTPVTLRSFVPPNWRN